MLVACICVFVAGIAAACGAQRGETAKTKVMTVTGRTTTSVLTYIDSAILTIRRPTALLGTASTPPATRTASGCIFSIVAQAGSESACVDSAGACHAYAYRKVRPKRRLVLEELHGPNAKRVCREATAFENPK